MGKVYLVGAGPGDPELITVKGLRVIRESDVILYDRLVNRKLLSYAKKDAKFIFCGKSPDHHTLSQEQINQLLCMFAKKGNIVTRLKGGDPFIFGRGAEEAEVLQRQGIPFEIVPGITSGSAAPAYAGIPLTHRDYSSSVTFISGVRKNNENSADDWKYLASTDGTICIYMGVRNLGTICEKLIRYGKDPCTPVAMIQNGTTPEQKTVIGTLENIVDKAKQFKNPAMIVIGDVVRLRDSLQWFEWKAEEWIHPQALGM